ncbi:MAG: NAD(P)-dependent oxidoreductase [bacterium]
MNKQEHIFIDENIPYLADILSPFGIISKFSGRDLSNEVLIQTRCDFLFVRSTTNINRELLKNTKVKFVGTATSGIDHVDTEYLNLSGVHFADAAGSNSNSVAEMVVYSIIKWSKITGKDLSKTTIGIIGFGHIGKIVAELSRYLGLKILVNDPPLLDENFEFPDFLRHVDLKTLCSKSDIITNHIPMTQTGKYPTYNLIGEIEISLLKEGSLFIHASRGYIVKEKPLLDRLKKKEVFASIDVWENEPLINPELVKLCILATPHVGGYSRDGKLRGVKMMADAFQKFTGEPVDISTIKSELDEYNPVEPAKYKDIDFIYNLLSQKRKFDEDHGVLLETMNLPDKERATAFDRLRKNYSIRRESL